MPAGDRKLTPDELGRLTPTQYANAAMDLVVVLDNVRSRHNVGAFFRTADAFGIGRILLCGFTPIPPHREIEKTALGATLSVPWSHHPDTLQAIHGLKAEGYRIIVVEQTLDAVPFTALGMHPGERAVLVFGNELEGVADAVVDASDACVMIPQRGSKHSLNVSVCGGILLWWAAGWGRPVNS